MVGSRVLFSLVVLLGALVCTGCKSGRQVFEVKGVVKELKSDGKTAAIAHETIPNYMEAMTMDFEVKDPRELQGLKPGDAIAFRLVVTKDDGWIENVRKLPPAAPAQASELISINAANDTNSSALTFRRSPIVEPLDIGNPVPDYKFTNQFGQPISLAQFRGKALGLTFFFTRCPYPKFCPLMSQNFQKAQNALKTAPNTPTNWSLVSLTIDPAWDTPERMLNYSGRYGIDTNRWQFAVSDLWTLDGLGDQLGLTFYRSTPAALPEHNLRTIVIDAQGRLQKVFVGNDWTVDEFVSEMVKAAMVK